KKYKFNLERKDIVYNQNTAIGISKNRNITISMASADICLISDDDVNYSEKYLRQILKAFEENPEVDIITFKVKTNPSEPEFREYPHFTFCHNIRTIFKVSSIEIAFRLKNVKQAGIKFDENFGLGAIFNLGEENIFLMDALKKGIKIKYSPYYVVYHPYKRSGILDKFNNEKLISLGALFYRMFGLFCILFNVFSAFYNYPEFKSQKSVFKYLALTFKGSWLAYKTINRKKGISLLNLLKLFFKFFKDLKKERT
ncbi:MAG: glycosyltransferase, partial [Candidatus Thorarchaeota archaeon]